MSDFASLTLELDTTPFEESLRECEEAVNGLNASGSVESSGADGAGERIGPEVLNALNSASLTGVGATLETISGQLAEIYRNDDDRHHEIADRHDRHDDIQAFHGGILAQDNDRREHHQHHRGHNGRDGERIGKGRADRVADDLADAAPADEARNGKQHRDDGMTQLFAPLALGQHMEVVGWAAPPAAVQRVRYAVLLRQSGLYKGGGSTQQGGDPHPEHRARTARRNSGHHAHKVARAHPGSGGDDQRLEGGKPARSLLFFAHRADHIPEQAHRQQPGAQGKADTGCKQKHHHEGDANAARHWQGE